MFRESLSLLDNWRYARGDAGHEQATDDWDTVSLPHTWNAIDGQSGKKANPQYPLGYYRGPGCYARRLEVPATWRDRRVFLRFEAASLVSDVYLNAQHLGQHRGAFAAFCYELTEKLHWDGSANELRVRVDNSPFEDVMPLSGDFTVFGGLYRPVHLFSTAPVCITPLDDATSGVFVTTALLTDKQAELEVEVKVANGAKDGAALSVAVEIIDADRKVVANSVADCELRIGETRGIKQRASISNPHRWHGRNDPYLYTVHVRLMRDGVAIDEVIEQIGLRTIAIDEARGFLLNGKPYPVRGVNRHQDRPNHGWAISQAAHEEDFEIIREIGATAVRLAHYQQSNAVLEICDRIGFVVWEEIPNVERINGTDAFADNARRQLTEMIRQGWNHPSIVWWGIYNELNANWITLPGEPVPVEPLLKSLYQIAKTLDPSRLVVGASWTTDPWPMHQIVDHQCYNNYPGWYWGRIEDFASVIEKGSAGVGGKKVAISEYGAGANPAQHEEGELKPPHPEGQWHPEEWQALTHETEWAIARENPLLWGTFVWNMFDFASAKRDEGAQPGINDKGLVTYDRKLRKDAFYFYQANWATEPMVYLAERRMNPRRQTTTTVKAYSNCAKVELRLNGKAKGTVAPDEVCIARWKDVQLQPGRNVIEVAAVAAGETVRDTCIWFLNEA